LFCSAHQTPSPRRHVIRVAIPTVIRFVFREVGFMFSTKSVVLALAEPRLRAFHTEFFEKLHQAIKQLTPSANHVQPTLVLMLFKYFVQAAFQFTHNTPSDGL
jgi:hypothetical protein